jgi:hypothetical protein
MQTALETPTKEPKRKLGRPTKYNKKLAYELCERIAKGESLLAMCRDSENYPSTNTVYEWLLKADESEELKQFRYNYEHARAKQAEVFFEQLDELALLSSTEIVGGDDKADNARVQARRLQVDTLKWRLSKMLPKKYGDKLDLTSGGEKLPTPILQLNAINIKPNELNTAQHKDVKSIEPPINN